MVTMIIASVIVLLGVIGLGCKIAAEKSPEGYEDHDGFHVGHQL